MLPVFHSYVTCMYSYVIRLLLVCSCILSVFIRMSFLCHFCVLVCHLYVTRMYSYVMVYHSYVLICHLYITRMYSYIIRMSLVCTRMPSVCHLYVLVCHKYVTRVWFYHEH